jgi:hypothetical protein
MLSLMDDSTWRMVRLVQQRLPHNLTDSSSFSQMCVFLHFITQFKAHFPLVLWFGKLLLWVFTASFRELD